MTAKHSLTYGNRERGLGLIEVLVAVVVLSTGLLGLAGLQMTGLRYNHSAYLRSQATILAYEIADRMRANRDSALNGDYNIAISGSPTAPTNDCISSSCTPSQVAALDKFQWIQRLGSILPSGDGSINVQSDGLTTIVVQWDDTRGVGDAKQFQLTTQL